MPKRLGHYEIVTELGRGGMGVVYKAYEPALDRHVAIKVLSDQMAEDPVVVARFQREARSVAALNHPNIIQIFFIGESEGRHYFVMEFVEGESLSAFIRRQTRVPVSKALEITIQIAEGLAAAHDIGVVHRDIKPANIMLDRHGRVKIADFGIALTADLQKKLTSTGQFLGTPGYLSPEVCLGEKADARTDIFSLGIVLYEMLSGEVPFHADSPLAMLSKVVNEAVPDVRQINQSVALGVQTILSKMVEKNRENRYADCHRLLDVLKDELGKSTTVRTTQKSMMTAPTEAIQVPGQAPPPPPQQTEAMATSPEAPKATEAIQVPPVPPPPGTEPMMAQPAPPIQKPVATRAKKRGWLLPVFLLLLVPVLAGGGYFIWQQQKGPEPNPDPPIANLDEDPPPGDHQESTGAMTSDETGPEQSMTADPDGVETSAIRRDPNHEGGTQPHNSPEQGTTEGSSIQTEDSRDHQNQSLEDLPMDGGGGGQTALPPGENRNAIADPLPPKKTADNPETREKITKKDTKEEPIATIGTPQVVVFYHGDSWVGDPIAQDLQSRLAGSGFDIQDSAMLTGLDSSPESKLSLPGVMDTVASQGGHVLVLAQVTFLGERTLNYMGRQSQAYNSRIKITGINLLTKKKITRDWTTEFEYTQLNAKTKVEEAMRDLPDSWVEAVRNAAQSLK